MREVLRPEMLRQTGETLVVAGAGAALFTLAHVPAGGILGAMIFTACACLMGRRLGWPQPIRYLQLFVTGLGAGAAVTPAALHAAAIWPVSIVALGAVSLGTWWLGTSVFEKVAATDRRTAAYATAPGALTLLMAMAEADGADIPKVAVAQTLRISSIVCLAPFAFAAGPSHSRPVAAPGLIDQPYAWIVLIAVALGGWALAHRLRWPLPVFLGALAASALMHGFGVVTVVLPQPLLLPATAGIGAVIGSRFSGLKPIDLWRYIPPSLAVLGIMAAAAVPTGLAIGYLIGVGPAAGLLAFAPGSMETMIAAALSLNAQPAYVASHQVARTLLLIMLVPLLSTRMARAIPQPADDAVE